MRRTKIRMIIFPALVFALASSAGVDGMSQPAPDQRVEAVLKLMNLEEKVGQMTQITIETVSMGEDGRQEPHRLDPAKLENAVVNHTVGSILNVGTSGYTLDHWHEVITRIQDLATKKTRLKIPVLYGIDAIHGANYTLGATIFPQPVAQAATWDPQMVQDIGRVTATEVRASGIPWNFYPVLDLGRQPLWSRLWETFGEDVALASALGVAYIQGLQGENYAAEDKVASCLKHYVGYGFPFSGRDRTPAWIDERMMREYFLPPFEAAVKAGAPTVMVNSSEVNGIPGHANHYLLSKVLKGEMGFKGFVVSDWEDVKRLHTRDRVADSPKEAVRMAVMAGVDMSMVPLDFSFYDLLLELVREGAVPLSRIDDAVRRILKVKFDLGLFERPYPTSHLKSRFATDTSTALNLRAAQEGITLLKNDRAVLPLSGKTRVLVVGPTADRLSALNGGWTITWQGDRDDLYPKDKMTIRGALEAKLGPSNVRYVQGTTFDTHVNIPEAVAAAKDADVIVLCLGEKAYCETPGSIDDLTLEDAQLTLAERMAGTGKPVVLVLVEGRPRVIRRIVNSMAAILMAYLPGMEGGRAIADILLGDANPCGKLPFSYPRFPNALMSYDCKPLELVDGNRYNPEFPFGFGMSYSTFAYSDLALSNGRITRGQPLQISVNVKNTGARPGKEVVQLYLTDLYASVSRPVRQMKRFSKIALQPGEERVVTFQLETDDLAFVGLDYTRIIEPGEFVVTVADLSQHFTLE